MLTVKSPGEVRELIAERFGALRTDAETVHTADALFGTLAEAVTAESDVPAFDRAAMDGYALRSCDVFGCTQSQPALLTCAGEVMMGEPPARGIGAQECMYVPTGGALPAGADAVLMKELAEDFGAGQIGALSPCAPGLHVVYRGDDVSAGSIIYPAGTVLQPKDIGALSALGYGTVRLALPPRVAVISTGDELIPPGTPLSGTQVYDSNAPMLAAAVTAAGGAPVRFPIIRDELDALCAALRGAAAECDLLLVSGGSSAGERDLTVDAVQRLGWIYQHGIAIKPGKPTIIGAVDTPCGQTPLIGLPGNPVAAYFIFRLFVSPLISSMLGRPDISHTVAATLDRALPSNHGREECVPVTLKDGVAVPVSAKSGLIARLSAANGFICIPRDAEGLPAGAQVTVYPL